MRGTKHAQHSSHTPARARAVGRASPPRGAARPPRAGAQSGPLRANTVTHSPIAAAAARRAERHSARAAARCGVRTRGANGASDGLSARTESRPHPACDCRRPSRRQRAAHNGGMQIPLWVSARARTLIVPAGAQQRGAGDERAQEAARPARVAREERRAQHDGLRGRALRRLPRLAGGGGMHNRIGGAGGGGGMHNRIRGGARGRRHVVGAAEGREDGAGRQLPGPRVVCVRPQLRGRQQHARVCDAPRRAPPPHTHTHALTHSRTHAPRRRRSSSSSAHLC